MAINFVVLMGRLTADPELKHTPNGVSVTSFSVAVDRGYAKQGEDRKADFLDVVAWRQTAEFVTQHFRKGQMIALQGHIETRSFTDRDGNKRKATEIIAEQVSFCGGKNETELPVRQQTAQLKTAAPDVEFEEIEPSDDLPF